MADSLFEIDGASLTLGELTAIYELTGLETPDIFAAIVDGTAAYRPDFMLALQLIAGKRDDVEYTLVDAGAVKYFDLIGTSDADT